ncbi:hypothetical protein LOC67_23995 [Stieleria sp. JC731]|uniref:hypothetical protein n=1 Tax=Pirellulaceae TaxID=2691357 RepID=UPI001E5ADF20|nr:hypothetical protein [Stieleria sp. JC731]MCC9603624.1 hypothetical protein [Stieleria sp. JC731]
MSESINPFQAPPQVVSESGSVVAEEAVDQLEQGIWFVSDWSRDGLASRNQLDSRQKYFVGLMIIACIAAAMATLYLPSLFVVVLPAAFAIAVTWIANVGIFDDRRFWGRYPGFATRVEGRLTRHSIAVRSENCVLTAMMNQSQVKIHPINGMIKVLLPFATESTRLSRSDIQRPLTEEELQQSEVPIELMKSLLGNSQTIEVTGQLFDNDLHDRQRQLKRWTAVAFFQLIWALLIFSQFMPIGFVNPNGAYSWLAYPATWLVVYGIGVLLIFACFYSILNAELGEFHVLVTSDLVVISRASYQNCYGYRNHALQHFVVNGKGLECRLRNGNLRMMVPRRWFTADQFELIQQWYPTTFTKPDRDYIVGPLV